MQGRFCRLQQVFILTGHLHYSSSFKYSNCGHTNWLQKAKIVNTLNLRQSGWTTCKSWSWYEPVGERARTPLPLLCSRFSQIRSALVTLFLMVAKCKDELCKIHFNCYVFFGLCSETCLLWIFYKSLITQLGVLGLTLIMGITHHKHVNIFIIHVVIK